MKKLIKGNGNQVKNKMAAVEHIFNTELKSRRTNDKNRLIVDGALFSISAFAESSAAFLMMTDDAKSPTYAEIDGVSKVFVRQMNDGRIVSYFVDAAAYAYLCGDARNNNRSFTSWDNVKKASYRCSVTKSLVVESQNALSAA